MTDRLLLAPRKPRTLWSFLLVALIATALFVPTFSGYTAMMNKVNIDATTTDVALSEDGERVVVDIRVENPTGSAFTARYGSLYGKVDDRLLTGLGVEVETTKIPPGETRTVTARIEKKDGHGDELEDAVESGELAVTGQLEGTIQEADVEVQVTEGDDG